MAVVDAPTGIPGFPVHWDDPAEENRTYTMDLMHHPHPITSLSQTTTMRAFAEGWMTASREIGMPFRDMHVRFQNYYYFDCLEFLEPPTAEEGEAGAKALEETLKRECGRLMERWEGEHLPRLKQILARLGSIEEKVATAPGSEVEPMLHEIEQLQPELWSIHFRIAFPMLVAMQMFDELYADLFGGADADAHAVLLGRLTRSVAAGIGLSDLAISARQAGLDRLIIDTPGGELVDALRMSLEGRAFLNRLSVYLDEFGYRSDLFDFAAPTWREDPTIPLASVRAYLLNGHDARAEHEAQARAADAALDEARARLAGYPEPVRGQFEAFVQMGRAAAFLQEEHNFYIDQQGLARARLVFMQIGRRLVGAGALDEPEDVLVLEYDEIKRLLGTRIDGATRERTRAIVAERRAGLERAKSLTPPPFLGPPPVMPEANNPMIRGMMRFFGGPPQTAEAPDQLKGNAGSRGVATGRAFVARNLNEATGLQPGQILVATTTMPAWTPLFGVAAGVVTETGGPLSHCAIVAREYGIPAVVGAAGATKAIRTGQTITVDGTRGVVLLAATE